MTNVWTIFMIFLYSGNIPCDKGGKGDTFFMIAANENENGEGADEYAELRSPFFKSIEHPVECFSFWFYFGVRFLISLN